jgi:NTPase
VDEGTPRLLLEGRPGIGKTTVARRLVAILLEGGVPVGGFTTAELRTGGRREGFVVQAVSGAQAAAARLASLPAWRPARVVNSNPDAPQLPVRTRTLTDAKLLDMAIPRLAEEGPFIGGRRPRRPQSISWEHLDAARIAAIPALSTRAPVAHMNRAGRPSPGPGPC